MSDTAKIAEALAAFQAEMPTVAKSKRANVGQYSYTYADLADVTEAAMPLLSKHGLAFSSCPQRTESGYEVVGVLLHTSGESLSGALPLTGRTAQEIGSSLTYNRRYLFGCLTGIVTDNDDDGTLATKGQQKRQQQPQQRRQDRPADKGISEAQQRMMGALMREAGMTDRDLALAFVADVIGREVSSRNELTSQEAGAVIDRLQKEQGVPA